MKVAKTPTIIIIWVCFFEGLSAQTIAGSFTITNANDVGVNITFNNDSTFTEILHQHLQGKRISRGHFSLERDTLNLHYEAINGHRNINVSQKRMERISGEDSIFPLYAKIRMLNNDGSPKPGPILVLQNEEKEVVHGFTTNIDGSFPPISLHDPYIKYFQISYLGNERIEIATDSLLGYRSEISIVFDDSNVEYGRENRTEKWVMESWSEDKMVFRGFKNGRLIVLERIE